MEEKVTKYSTGVCQFSILRDGVTAKIKPKDAYVSVSRAEKREHQKTL